MKETVEVDMAPLQNLLRTLIASAVRTCIVYRKTGRIPSINRSGTELEYHRNLQFLKELDPGMIMFAGFQDDQIAQKAIQMVIEGKGTVEPEHLKELETEETACV